MKLFVVPLAAAALLACAPAAAGQKPGLPDPAAPEAHDHHAAFTHVGYVPRAVLRYPATLRAGIGRLHDPATTASADAQRFYDQGLAYLHSYAFIESVRSFEQALRLDPEMAMAYVGLSRAYGSLFDPEAAREALRQAEARRERVTAREQRRIDLRARHLEAAADPGSPARHREYKEALDRALALDPDDAELWILRGNAEEPHAAGWGGQLGSAAAIAFYQAALALHPDHFPAHHYLVHAYENIGRFDRAVHHGEIYARLVPDIAHAQHMLAHNLIKVGRAGDAVRQLLLADSLEHAYYQAEAVPRDLDWHHPHNRMLLALAHQHQGRLAEAERLLRAVESMTPTLPAMEAWYRKDLPDLLLAQGRAGEARAAGERLLRLRTPLARALGHLVVAQSHLAQSRTRQAAPHLDSLDRALAAMEGRDFVAQMVAIDLRAAIARGEFLLRTGDRDGGDALLRGAVRQLRGATGPDEWIEALFRLESIARTARAVGAWALAEHVAREMTAHDPSYPGGFDALGLALRRTGDRAGAERADAEAARLRRGSPAPTPAAARAAAPGERTDREEANVELVRRFWEAWDRQDWDAMEGMVAPGYRHHFYRSSTDWQGFREGSTALRIALPDWRLTVQEIVAAGDRVAVRFIGRGTHRGPYFGIAPSGTSIVAPLAVFVRVADGRIAEDWEYADYCSLLNAMQPRGRATPDVREMCALISGIADAGTASAGAGDASATPSPRLAPNAPPLPDPHR